ncbi:MAG: hypothetical protein ACJAZO_004821 [Myxococcota bacterium]|jgi:hypothetical protein
MFERFNDENGKTYPYAKRDQKVTYDTLQDAVDDALADIVFDLGIRSDADVKKRELY